MSLVDYFMERSKVWRELSLETKDKTKAPTCRHRADVWEICARLLKESETNENR